MVYKALTGIGALIVLVAFGRWLVTLTPEQAKELEDEKKKKQQSGKSQIKLLRDEKADLVADKKNWDRERENLKNSYNNEMNFLQNDLDDAHKQITHLKEMVRSEAAKVPADTDKAFADATDLMTEAGKAIDNALPGKNFTPSIVTLDSDAQLDELEGSLTGKPLKKLQALEDDLREVAAGLKEGPAKKSGETIALAAEARNVLYGLVEQRFEGDPKQVIVNAKQKLEKIWSHSDCDVNRKKLLKKLFDIIQTPPPKASE